MKRIFTISVAAVMALLMVLSLTACGNSTLGYYKLTSAEASGMSFDSSTLAAVGMDKGYILLKEDGKAIPPLWQSCGRYRFLPRPS